MLYLYRIARNFRGLKFSRFSRIRIIPRKFYPRKFYPRPRIFMHCINIYYSNWHASCSSVNRHGSLPIVSNLRQINDVTWSPWSSFSIGAFILHSIGKWESELVEGGQWSTVWLQQSASTLRSYPITFRRRVASGRGALTPERCRQVALSLAIRSAFQSAFQPAFDTLLGVGVVKLILNGRGKPYVHMPHPRKLNREKFVEGLSAKILILENF